MRPWPGQPLARWPGLVLGKSRASGSHMSDMSRWLAAASAAVVFAIAAASQPAQASGNIVAFNGYSPGTIVVKTNERRLYYVVDAGHAIRYPVGVGKAGKQWAGVSPIHGTNMPGSVGGFVSYGCIRMYNADITDLFGRVSLGAPVVVTH